MNIVVCVKDIFHPHGLRAPANGHGPRGIRAPNRADECAVEMAVRLCERYGGRLTLLSTAPPEAVEILDMYVGLGAARLVRIWDESLADADQVGIALALERAVVRLSADLVLCGERSVGGEGTGLVGPALADRLGWPFVGGAASVEPDGNRAIVHRLIERGDRIEIRAPLPAVISISREANVPRYPAYAKIRRAARRTWGLEALGLSPEDIAAARSPARVAGWAAARPRPKKLFAPPSSASAADRLRIATGGGAARKSQDQFVEASPEKAAEQILAFLRQEKLI